jgi:hypothetical protein
VNERLPDAALPNGSQNWRGLNEVRSGTNYMKNVLQMITL